MSERDTLYRTLASAQPPIRGGMPHGATDAAELRMAREQRIREFEGSAGSAATRREHSGQHPND